MNPEIGLLGGLLVLVLGVSVASLLTARGLAKLVHKTKTSVETLGSLVEKLRHAVRNVDKDKTRTIHPEEQRKIGHERRVEE